MAGSTRKTMSQPGARPAGYPVTGTNGVAATLARVHDRRPAGFKVVRSLLAVAQFRIRAPARTPGRTRTVKRNVLDCPASSDPAWQLMTLPASEQSRGSGVTTARYRLTGSRITMFEAVSGPRLVTRTG